MTASPTHVPAAPALSVPAQRALGIAVVMATLLGLAAGCTDAGTSTSPAPNPTLPPSDWAPVTEFGPCHQVTISPGDTNGGYVAAFDWDDDVHAYGESVPLKGCFTTVGVAIPQGPPGVTFDPVQQQVPADEFGVVNFTVTVSDGSSGEILVELVHNNGNLFATPPGPVITPSGDGWKFTFPDLS